MAISDNQKKLLHLLANGDFKSGTELAEALGLSRSAVWKQLNGLADLGVECIGVSGKGYRLNSRLEFLAEDKILPLLDVDTKARCILEIHDQLDSTNSYLLKKSQRQAPSGLVCLAEHQTAGKGRRGRNWVSPYGSNIYLSLLWHFPHNGLGEISGLSLAVGVAVVRALKQLQFADVGLKWPNDLYWQGKKLGGILIEVSGEASGPCCAVIGLGLNLQLSIAQAESINQPWTDLNRMANGKKIGRNHLAAALLNHLVPVVAEFGTTGIGAYVDEWRANDCLLAKPACLYVGNQALEGIVRGIDGNGLLLLEHPDGQIRAYASGEVSFHRVQP